MPITPLHLGLLAPLNHWFPKRVNNFSFLLVTLWIDAAAIAYYAFGVSVDALHPPSSHSFIAVGAISGIIAVLKCWDLSWIYGAYLGGFSHVLLDAMVHAEMLPFHPLPGNPFYWGGMEWISLLLIPPLLWLIAQYVLGGCAQVRRIRAALQARQRWP